MYINNCNKRKLLSKSKKVHCENVLFQYLSELTLVECDPYLSYNASEIASAAVCLANHTLGNDALVSKRFGIASWTYLLI